MVSQIRRAIREAAIVALLVGGVAGQVLAQEEDFGANRPYLGGGLLYSIPNFDGFNDNTREAESTFGFDIRAGYRWRYVAVEADFQYFKRFDLQMGQGTETLKAFTFGPNVKGYPLHGRFQPYLMGGIGVQQIKAGSGLDDGSEGVGRFGGGFELYLMPNMAFFAEGAYNLGIESDYDMINTIGGVQFHIQ